MNKNKYTDDELTKAVSESDNLYDVIRKLGGSLTSGALYRHLTKRIQTSGIDRSHFKRPTDISAKKNKLTPKEILIYDRRNGLRERTSNLRNAMKEVGVKEVCECGIGLEWMGKKLTLEIDHIDGDCLNNKISNLRFICPNCHSQTETYNNKNERAAKKVD